MAQTFRVVQAIEELDARPGHIISLDRSEPFPVAVVRLHGPEAERIIRRHLDCLQFQSGRYELLPALPAPSPRDGRRWPRYLRVVP